MWTWPDCVGGFPISLKGATLVRVIEIAHALGLESRPLRTEVIHLSALRAPSILHWDMNHFVVLKRATARGLEIHDPVRGFVRVSARGSRRAVHRCRAGTGAGGRFSRRFARVNAFRWSHSPGASRVWRRR